MSTLNVLAQQIYQNAKDHGFWDGERNFGEMIALAHSELSEALEEHRAGRPAEWWNNTCRGEKMACSTDFGCCCPPKPEGVAVELADCIIRCLDTMRSLDVDIDAVVGRKMLYNATRPHKHGKSY